MFNSMAKASLPQQSISAQLQTIWLVEADKTYDVVKRSGENYYIALRTTSGNGILTLAGIGDLRLSSDTLIIFNFSKVIRYYCAEDNWSFFWFEFTADPVNLVALDVIHNIKIFDEEQKKLMNCFHTLNSPMHFSSLRASCDFCAILAFWSSSIVKNTSNNPLAIEKALKYISEHSSEEISVLKLAQIAQMSERTFRNTFKAHTKISPKKYVEEKKLNMAKELLINTDIQVKVIAVSLGFSNQYYFSRAFRKMFGFSPTLYRKQNINI